MSLLFAVEIAKSTLAKEYLFHRKRFHNINDFKKYIIRVHISCFPNPNRDNQQCDVDTMYMDYDLYRESTAKMYKYKVYGVLIRENTGSSPWKLKDFMVLSIRKRKKKHKFKKHNKAISTQNGRSYDRNTHEQLKISHAMTETIIPSQIKEHMRNKDIVYHYMRETAALHTTQTIYGDIWILICDLHDKETNVPLYGIADKIKRNEDNEEQKEVEVRGYKWELRDTLYTAVEVKNIVPNITTLPTTIRDIFLKQRQYVQIMEDMLNDPQKRATVFHERMPWHQVAVFTNDNDANKRHKKVTVIKKAWNDDCIAACLRIKMIPILLFNDHGECCIDALWRLHICGGDMAISFKYNSTKRRMYPTGIHLERDRVEVMCKLVDPTACVSGYFDDWTSAYNDFGIGNRKDTENKLKDAKNKLNEAQDHIRVLEQKLQKSMHRRSSVSNPRYDHDEEIKYNAENVPVSDEQLNNSNICNCLSVNSLQGAMLTTVQAYVYSNSNTVIAPCNNGYQIAFPVGIQYTVPSVALLQTPIIPQRHISSTVNQMRREKCTLNPQAASFKPGLKSRSSILQTIKEQQ